MSWLPNAITIAACLAIAGRLLLFRRGHRRRRFGCSLVAWVLINAAAALALILALHARSLQVSWFVAVVLALFAVHVFRARGNVAKLWRLRP